MIFPRILNSLFQIRINNLTLFILIIFLFSNLHSLKADELLIKQALENNLYESKEWKALLHVRNNKPQIFSKSFLYSFDNFSLENELILTINSFK